MKKLARLGMAAILASAISSVSHADEGFYFSEMLIHYQLQDDINFDSKIGGNFGGGYKFNGPWALELSRFMGAADVNGTKYTADVDHTKVDALYYIWEDRFSPYAAFGVGRTNVDYLAGSELNRSTNTFNLGGGFDYKILGNLSFRGDLRFLRDHGQADNDVMLGFGINYHFGGSEENAKPVNIRRDLDTDGDGVLDSKDRCPNTPALTSVDQNGCTIEAKKPAPVAVKQAAVVKEVRLEVNFDTNSSNVASSYLDEIQEVAIYMDSHPNSSVTIEGHTDSRGSDKYNTWLSDKRAAAVADVLVKQFGISSSRVSSVGYGESKPMVANDTAANMALNRRVIAVFSN